MSLFLRTARLLRPQVSLKPSQHAEFFQPSQFIQPRPFGHGNRPNIRNHPRFRSSYNKPIGASNEQTNMNIIYGIIGINSAVILYGNYCQVQAQHGIYQPITWFYQNFTLNLAEFLYNKRYWTSITAVFSHLDFFHFAGNMVSFYFMGRLLAQTPRFSPRNFLTLVIGSGLSGSFTTLLQNSQNVQGDRQRGQKRVSLGFSGAVMGVGATAACMYPSVKFAIYGIIPVPLWALVSAYFVYDGVYLNSQSSRIGHAGHLGGGIFGLMFYFLKVRRGRIM